ncbi:zinc finger, CCHC-type containing protein [Tanacetum coccineum]
MGGSSSQPHTEQPISFQETTRDDSLVEVTGPPLKSKSKPTRGHQNRTVQNEDAAWHIAWTNEEEITLCKGWVHVSESSKLGCRRVELETNINIIGHFLTMKLKPEYHLNFVIVGGFKRKKRDKIAFTRSSLRNRHIVPGDGVIILSDVIRTYKGRRQELCDGVRIPSHEGYQNIIEWEQCGAFAIRHHPFGAKRMLIPWTSVRGSKPISYGFFKTCSNWLECLPAGSISTWEDLTARFLAQFFPPGRTSKFRNDILMFKQHQGESLSEAWTRFKDLLQKVPHHGIDLWLQIQIFYDHVSFHLKSKIDRVAGGKLRYKNTEESWEIIENLALYNHEGWNDPRDFAKLRRVSKNNKVVNKNVIKPEKSNVVEPIEEVDEKEEVEDGTNDEPVRSVNGGLMGEKVEQLVEIPRSQPVGFYLKHKINKELIEGLVGKILRLSAGSAIRLTDEELVGTDIRLSLASHSYIYLLGIDEDVLVEIADFIYTIDFVILDIKEDKRRPFILGTLFLATTRAGIRFDKGVITLRSGKNRVNFHKILKFLCKIEEEAENDIDPVTPISTVIFDEENLEFLGVSYGRFLDDYLTSLFFPFIRLFGICEAFGENTHDLDSIWEETRQDCSFTRSGFKNRHTRPGDDVTILSDAVRTYKGRSQELCDGVRM